MKIIKSALIGFGAIGAPIADRLHKVYSQDFYLVMNEERKRKFENGRITVNSHIFAPKILTDRNEEEIQISLLIVGVKNYDLCSAMRDIEKIVDKNTVILPLQNGIFAYDFFRNAFPQNVILKGYIQGPNTERKENDIVYQNAGVIHIGSEDNYAVAKEVYSYLKSAGLEIIFESNISKAVWKKWMLNVAGNSVTALTGADYSQFKVFTNLQNICLNAMREFAQISRAEGVYLDENDIQDVLQYYVSYDGNKKTSMLVDVLNERKTENKYLSGKAVEIAKKHNISIPTITTLYYLMETKELVYMDREGCRTMNYLFRENVQYTQGLRVNIQDINDKMKSSEYTRIVCESVPEELTSLLKYATESTGFYASLKDRENLCLSDFPVMNKTILNENYDSIYVHTYDSQKIHKMHTSGSTGIPFTVIQNEEKRERHIADLKYFGALAGYLDRDPMCYLRAKPTATPEEQERDNIWQLDICNLNEKNLTDYFRVMVDKQCTALIAYPSTLETAVNFWSEHFTNESCIKTIISTSETLTDEVKEKLRNFFGDKVGIYARYSNTEQGILGQETGESGRYCLNWASYYFEILKMDSDEPAEDGELGRIVITDLYNRAFPMIRYDTGDVAKMIHTKGRLPELEELFGRRMDLIYDTNGEVVSPFLLCRTMRLSHGIEQWQFIQETKDAYKLKITSNSSEKPNVENEVEGFKKTLGQDAVINVEYVQDIPVMNSLKRKLIVSMLNR